MVFIPDSGEFCGSLSCFSKNQHSCTQEVMQFIRDLLSNSVSWGDSVLWASVFLIHKMGERLHHASQSFPALGTTSCIIKGNKYQIWNVGQRGCNSQPDGNLKGDTEGVWMLGKGCGVKVSQIKVILFPALPGAPEITCSAPKCSNGKNIKLWSVRIQHSDFRTELQNL